jgi:hypothetical protein
MLRTSTFRLADVLSRRTAAPTPTTSSLRIELISTRVIRLGTEWGWTVASVAMGRRRLCG